MNPYTETGEVMEISDTTSSEEVRKRLPGARLVKAFNTIYYQHLATHGRPGAPLDQRDVIFITGDDAPASRPWPD